jgi:hypothetical protein
MLEHPASFLLTFSQGDAEHFGTVIFSFFLQLRWRKLSD